MSGAVPESCVPAPPTPDLDGKVAIVTGASRGIGKGLAIGLADAGAAVVCAARSTADDPGEFALTIDDTVEEITARGGRALGIRCDIGNAQDIRDLVERTVGELGRVDVLVNNAMAPTRGSFDESTGEMWDASMRVNVRSLFVSAKCVVPHMRSQGGGSIVNMSSHAADPLITGMPPGYVTYSTAKAALERFSTALADELREANVAVNALRPGAIKTEMTVHELGEIDWTGWGEPADIVPAVNHLAAQDAAGITGRILDSTQFGVTWPEPT
jgi:NAD(P)-dependent dehydrogenase (short-subunit alcohol dehydrogenase family)